MKQISGSWRYPIEPSEGDVLLQQTLRGNRNSSQRFVQAAGALSRCLGGKLQTSSPGNPAINLFQRILPIQPDGPALSRQVIFALTFLKAILLWLEGGPATLLDGFKRPVDQRKNEQSFPIPDAADESALHDILIPHLLRTCREVPIVSVDASRFEHDETRNIFDSETAAVIAFSQAIRMPLRDLSKAIMPAVPSSEEHVLPAAQDKNVALKYWGFKVGRSLLMKAGEGLDFQFIDIAYGGLGNVSTDEDKAREQIDLSEDDPVVESATLVKKARAQRSRPDQSTKSQLQDTIQEVTQDATTNEDASTHELEMSLSEQTSNDPDKDGGMAGTESETNENSEDGTDDEDGNEDDYDEGDDDDDDTETEQPFLFRSSFARSRFRGKVESNVACHSHMRTYRGHCNVKTVKDANFFGLQDEYVVSGSDGGHVFIWDKKTSELVNILEGDGEVVNVIQGHPHEPLLAVSGIDHTIKIFSPDSQAQEDARNGINISNDVHGSQGYSSLSHLNRRRRRGSNSADSPDSEGRQGEGLSSRKRMQESYQIVSQNDVRRQGGMRDAYITRGMLAQVAARLRARRAEGGGGAEGGAVGGLVVGEDGEHILVDDNCSVM